MHVYVRQLSHYSVITRRRRPSVNWTTRSSSRCPCDRRNVTAEVRSAPHTSAAQTSAIIFPLLRSSFKIVFLESRGHLFVVSFLFFPTHFARCYISVKVARVPGFSAALTYGARSHAHSSMEQLLSFSTQRRERLTDSVFNCVLLPHAVRVGLSRCMTWRKRRIMEFLH